MNIPKKTENILKKIWDWQLSSDERDFLYDLLEGKKSNNFVIDYYSDYSLFLAYNASKHNYEGYNNDQIAAFKNILNFNRSQILCKIPEISKVLRILNENGIIPVLIKGAALMAYYVHNIPRMMGDIDIYIEPKQFEKAIDLLLNSNYTFVFDTGYHVAVSSNKLDIDVHRYIFKNGGDVGSNIYDDLIETNFLSNKVYVLSPENMLIHQLANRGQDILTYNHPKRHFKWIIDCYYILKTFDADYAKIVNKAKVLKNEYIVLLTLAKLVELFPDKFSNVYINYNDKKYLKLLNCAYRFIKVSQRVCPDYNKFKGLLYIMYGFYRHCVTSKIIYYSLGCKKSFFAILLDDMHIHTLKDIVYRYKVAIGNSKKI